MKLAIAIQAETSSSWLYQTVERIGVFVWGTLRSLAEMITASLPHLLAGAIVLFLFWLIAKLVRGLFNRATRKTQMDVRIRILISRGIVASIYVIGIFAALSIIFPSFSFSTLITGLGVTSVVIGIAARDIVNNVISGILILWQRPFQIGDYIIVGSEQGKVEFIGVRATNLRTDDGELTLIPNGTLYTNAITVREAGEHRRMTLSFCLPYTVDLERAESIILKAVRSTDSVVSEPHPHVLASAMTADGIAVNATFWLNTGEYNPLGVLDRCLTSVHTALRQNGIVPFGSAEQNADSVDTEDTKPNSDKTKKENDDLLD